MREIRPNNVISLRQDTLVHHKLSLPSLIRAFIHLCLFVVEYVVLSVILDVMLSLVRCGLTSTVVEVARFGVLAATLTA